MLRIQFLFVINTFHSDVTEDINFLCLPPTTLYFTEKQDIK